MKQTITVATYHQFQKLKKPVELSAKLKFYMLHLFILTFVIFLSIHIAGDKSKLSLTTNCVVTESIYFYYTLQSHSFDFLYLLPFFS